MCLINSRQILCYTNLNENIFIIVYSFKYIKLLKQILKHLLFLFLTDITAVCILEQFQNQASIVTADRVLKELGSQKAKENVKARITFVF